MADSAVQRFCCRYCRQHLGNCTESSLQIGTALFHKVVTIQCANCHSRNRWAPAPVQTLRENAKRP